MLHIILQSVDKCLHLIVLLFSAVSKHPRNTLTIKCDGLNPSSGLSPAASTCYLMQGSTVGGSTKKIVGQRAGEVHAIIKGSGAEPKQQADGLWVTVYESLECSFRIDDNFNESEVYKCGRHVSSF